MTERSLLPVGFYDLIFDEAQENHRKINLALDFFMRAHYRLIKTPLLEFAQNFSDKQIQNSFTLVDVISGKNLVLRNDITPQIARVVSTFFRQGDLPLKICYVGDVLFTKSNELYADRQSTQVGLEIIGCDEHSHFEIIARILQILPQILTKKCIIEFSLPNFAQILCAELKIAQSEDLIDSIRKKDVLLIKKLAGKNADLISEIVLWNNDLENLSKLILSKANSKEIALKLENALLIKDYVAKNFAEVEICFDLFGDDKNSYHEEIAFDIFCEGFSYPIARGGKYKINAIDAVGATIYMNYLRRV